MKYYAIIQQKKVDLYVLKWKIFKDIKYYNKNKNGISFMVEEFNKNLK